MQYYCKLVQYFRYSLSPTKVDNFHQIIYPFQVRYFTTPRYRVNTNLPSISGDFCLMKIMKFYFNDL